MLEAFVCLAHRAAAQHISTCETVLLPCPLVFFGGNFTVKVFQVQRLPNGAQIQDELSNVSGNFGAGSQILPVTAYRTNGGANYNFRIRSSSGYAAQDNFRYPGNGYIEV